MTWPIHGLPLGALGLWFKLRLYRERWPKKAPTVAFAYRWGGRDRIRAWLSELAAASLVELRRDDEVLEAVTGLAESIVVVVRHWEPPTPEAISTSRRRWRLRKRRQSERLTPSFTPTVTPPSNSERGGSDELGRRARGFFNSAELGIGFSMKYVHDDNMELRRRARAVLADVGIDDACKMLHVSTNTFYKFLAGEHLRPATIFLIEHGIKEFESASLQRPNKTLSRYLSAVPPSQPTRTHKILDILAGEGLDESLVAQVIDWSSRLSVRFGRPVTMVEVLAHLLGSAFRRHEALERDRLKKRKQQ